MKSCSCGNKAFKCNLVTKATVTVTEKNGDPAHVSFADEIISNDYVGPFTCVKCGTEYKDLGKLENIVEIETSANRSISIKVDIIGRQLKELENKKNGLSCLMNWLPNDISKIEVEIGRLKQVYNTELDNFIHLHMAELYGIKDRHDANRSYLVFDEMARFIKVYRLKVDFEYTDDMEKVLMREKFSAHNASSFYSRSRDFYNLPFIEQLKILDWKFDASGRLIDTD